MPTDPTPIYDCPERAVEVVYEKSGTATFDHEVVPREAAGFFVNDRKVRVSARLRLIGHRRAPNDEGEGVNPDRVSSHLCVLGIRPRGYGDAEVRLDGM